MIREFRHSMLLPLAVACFQPLFVTSTNTGEIGVIEFLLGITVAICYALVVIGALYLPLRHRTGPAARAVISALLLAWMLFGVIMANEVRRAVITHTVLRLRLVLLLELAVVIALAIVAYRSATRARFMHTLFLRTLVILFVFAGTRTLVVTWRAQAVIANDRGFHAIGTLAPASQIMAGPAKRDIYFFVLDNFAKGSTLKREYAYSADAFEMFLRAHGFTIPAESRANYPYTILSVTSMLNASDVLALGKAMNPNSGDISPLVYLIQHNRLFRAAAAAGYGVYYVPSVSFTPTKSFPFPALAVGEIRQGILLSLLRSRLVFASYEGTFFGAWFEQNGWTSAEPTGFQQQASLVQRAIGLPGPKFVFVHLMLTHAPFLLNERCEPAESFGPRTGRSAYVIQARCLTAFLQRAIEKIDESSGGRAIVLLLADHGTNLTTQAAHNIGYPLSRREALELFGTFSAYRLPKDSLTSSVATNYATPIALSTALLRYLGVQVPPTSDSSYFAATGRPYRLRLVPKSLLWPDTQASSVRLAP